MEKSGNASEKSVNASEKSVNASADAPTGASPIRFDAARIKREAGEAATARAEKARAAPRRSTRGTPQKQTQTNPPSREGPRAGDDISTVDVLDDHPVPGGVDADAVVSTPVRRTDRRGDAGAPRWSSFDESYYAKMRVTYGAGGDPCAIARAIDGPPCVEVYRRLRADLQREGEAEASRSEHQSDAEDEEGRGGGGGRGGGRRKGGKRRKGWITQRKRTTIAVIRRRMRERGGPRVDPVHAVRVRSGRLQREDVRVHERRELLRKVLQLPRAALAMRQRVHGVQLQERDVHDARVPVLRRRARVRPRHLQALRAHRRDDRARAPRRVAVHRHLRARAGAAEGARRGDRRQDRSQRAVRQHEALPPTAQARVPRFVGRRGVGDAF